MATGSRRWLGQPAWGEFVLDAGAVDRYLIGGDHAGTQLWSESRLDLVERLPGAREHFGDPELQRSLLPELGRRRWVHVRASAWYGWWAPEPIGNQDVALRPELADVGSTWESMLEVERMLIEPYVARAVERRFHIGLEPRQEDGRPVFVPKEDRVWVSVLAPIYLQLFEALRRITEGEPGAAICRECGRPFVVLDARRRFFCNERERFRHSKREQRRRVSEPDIVLDDGTVIEIKVRRTPV